MLNRILAGDAISELKKIRANSIALCIFSPPYNKHNQSPPNNTTWTGKKNMRIEYDNTNDDMPEEDYQAWQTNVIKECLRVIKPNGSVWYNHKPRRIGGYVRLPTEWISQFKIWQVIIWDRTNTPQVNNFCFFPTVEYIYWIVKHKPKFHRNRAIFDTEVWRCPPVKNPNHPAPFTPKTVRNIILTCSDKGDIVLDPFCGIGTVCIEAKRIGRQYIGIDISKKYVGIARKEIRKV